MFKLTKNSIIIGIAVAGIVITGVIIIITQSLGGNPAATKKTGNLSAQEVATKCLDYLNNELLAGQATASITEATEESGLVKMKININNDEFDAYATLDGKLFFPQVFKLDEDITQSSSDTENQKSCEEIKKGEKPLLEAFVVSGCPFGLQMQRVLAEIVKNIPSLASNTKVRYIGSVSGDKVISMHGDEEAQENLRQICIREEAANKYWNYISCYIKAGESDNCLMTAGVNTSETNACMNDSSRGLKYAKEDFDLDEKYNITGSPTLILNEERASEFWFGGRTAEAVKTLICCGSATEPDSCNQKLSEVSAAVGFSETYEGSGTNSNGGGCE